MPRFVIDRDDYNRLSVSSSEAGTSAHLAIVDGASIEQITWIHSFVATGRKKLLCVCDGTSPPANRRIASRNMLPIGDITEICVFDPLFYNYPVAY